MSEDSMLNFLGRFSFKPDMVCFVGVEREHFLVQRGGFVSGIYAPRAQDFLRAMNDERWTYELSACQVESRTNPRRNIADMRLEILENEKMGNEVASRLGLRLANEEVGSANMPWDIYPEPRYLEIAKTISRDRLEAACRVTGTHIHLGVRNINHAIALNNVLVPHLDFLCDLGDHSNGERLRLYRTMAKNWEPMRYESPEHFFEVAQAEGFTDNPRDCYKLIRISIHGTVELRMFGSTNNVDEILRWIILIQQISGMTLLDNHNHVSGDCSGEC